MDRSPSLPYFGFIEPPTGPPLTGDGLTRRQALKRGIVLGAGLLWVTPGVEVVPMSRALAADTSPGPCVVYCIKWDVDTDKWENLGNGVQNCLICPDFGENELPPEELLGEFTVTPNADGSITVRYPTSCSLVRPDSTPDEFYGDASAAAKCGTGMGSCELLGPDDQETEGDEHVLTFTGCANGKEISHIELIIQCCDHDQTA